MESKEPRMFAIGEFDGYNHIINFSEKGRDGNWRKPPEHTIVIQVFEDENPLELKNKIKEILNNEI